MREFKRYKCMCGPNDGVCKFQGCLYAHKQKDLTIPSAFEEPAFPGEDAVWEIRYTSEQTGLESTLKLPRKFIANTFRKIDNSLCSHTYDWCSSAVSNHVRAGLVFSVFMFTILLGGWKNLTATQGLQMVPWCPCSASFGSHTHWYWLRQQRAVQSRGAHHARGLGVA